MSTKNSYLMHYGVKGMKWGVRHDRDRINRAFTEEYKGKPSPAEKSARASSDLFYTAGRMAARKRPPKKQDYSRMSNKDLRNRINRLEMEKRYSELSQPRYTSRRQRVIDVLDYSGDIMAISASAAIIATQIYKMRK